MVDIVLVFLYLFAEGCSSEIGGITNRIGENSIRSKIDINLILLKSECFFFVFSTMDNLHQFDEL